MLSFLSVFFWKVLSIWWCLFTKFLLFIIQNTNLWYFCCMKKKKNTSDVFCLLCSSETFFEPSVIFYSRKISTTNKFNQKYLFSLIVRNISVSNKKKKQHCKTYWLNFFINISVWQIFCIRHFFAGSWDFKTTISLYL